MKRVTCTYHCAACNGHFHSEASFDAHRQGEGRTCIEPLDDDRFMALSHEAKCEFQRVEYGPLGPANRPRYPAGWQPGDAQLQRVAEPVTVWSLRADVEAQRARFAPPLKPETGAAPRTDPNPRTEP